MYHGECVALGCVAAAYISWKKNYLSMDEYYEIRDMFVPFYLPISIDNIEPEMILKLTKSDKSMKMLITPAVTNVNNSINGSLFLVLIFASVAFFIGSIISPPNMLSILTHQAYSFKQ